MLAILLPGVEVTGPAWAAWIILAGAILAALKIVHSSVVGPLIKFMAKGSEWMDERTEDHNSVLQLKDDFDGVKVEISRMRGDLTEVKKMVTPNSGSSIIDQVVALREDLADMRREERKARSHKTTS